MDRLKDLWSGQDLINRIVLISGLAVFLWCLVKGQGLYGLVLLVVMIFLMVSRFNSLTKRRGRLYGTMYFHMPDGEIYPMTYEQMKSEYVHGQQSKYAGRRVSVKFMYSGLDENGDIDTGFGLRIRADEKYLQDWKKGQILVATGRIAAKSRDYFMIGEVEEIRLSTQKEDLTVSDEPKTEDHTKQEDKQNEIHD